MEIALGDSIFNIVNGLQNTVNMLRTCVWSEAIKFCCLSYKKGWMLGAKSFSW